MLSSQRSSGNSVVTDMANWNETKSILLELEQLFKRDDDIRDIEDIKKMAAEISFQREQHTKDLKSIIKREYDLMN